MIRRAHRSPNRKNVPGSASRRRAKSCSRAARLRVEPMEDRLLLSSGAGLTFAPSHLLYRPDNGSGPMATPGHTGLTPTQIRHAYGFDQISFLTSDYNANAGTGQTIAIVDAYDDPNIVNDLHPLRP